jgi:hypothetical protein
VSLSLDTASYDMFIGFELFGSGFVVILCFSCWFDVVGWLFFYRNVVLCSRLFSLLDS